MSDPMQEIMASFFVECEELHEALVEALQIIADGESDVETINVAFRAVHSIKGGAGAFGLDALVNFAHQFETVMDACRAGDLQPDGPLNALFLRCSDRLSDLIRCSRDGEPIDDAISQAMIDELAVYVVDDPNAAAEVEIEFEPMALDLGDLGAAGDDQTPSDFPQLADIPDSASSGLNIEFRPDAELYESGNEPLFLLRTLADLGNCEISLDFTPPKDFEDLGKLGNRLHWNIEIDTDQPPSDAQEIFEFSEGLCHLEITSGGQTAAPNLPGISNFPGSPNAPAIGSYVETPQTTPDTQASPASPPAKSDAPAIAPPNQALPNPAPPAKASKKAPTKASPTVRVDLERIERLVNLVGELVINQAMLSQSITEENIPSNSTVSAGLDEFQQLTRNIQESVMMIRAQPVKSLFQRMSRIVREASSAVDKSVKLVTEGDTTEIDKTAIERLADPLTHMIRNAVDHGLEETETRLANGKSRQGEIRLTAAHRSGRVLIEVSDDGSGINREKVRNIAVAKNLITEGAELSDGEIDQLLFLPGFSTAEEVSALSGRGVGMDVVKTQITSLGGRVTIDSTPGSGTTFAISLPLTLAVLDGMVVTIAGETLVVPLNAIIETISLGPSDLRPVSADQKVLCLRERFIPVLDLGVELGYREDAPPKEGTIALLIAPEEGSLVGLLVDTIEDQRQVVIKGLQESYGRVPGVAAATILGDGQIALILDPNDLVLNLPGDAPGTLQQRAS